MANSLGRNMKQGEKFPQFGQASVSSGTLIISGSPTCTLYQNGVAVSAAWTDLAVTGFDNTALATVRAWYDLDTTAPTALAVGWYTLSFKFTATGSDNIVRVYEPSIAFRVIARPD